MGAVSEADRYRDVLPGPIFHSTPTHFFPLRGKNEQMTGNNKETGWAGGGGDLSLALLRWFHTKLDFSDS